MSYADHLNNSMTKGIYSNNNTVSLVSKNKMKAISPENNGFDQGGIERSSNLSPKTQQQP
jgi:hypothetical protein